MPGFFDFLSGIERYAQDQAAIDRLNRRHRMVIAPLAAEIEGARVLDLAAHDGRWAHAWAGAGAREVIGIEGRPDLVARYQTFPDLDLRVRVQLEVGDIFDGLEARVRAGERFDIVGVLGIFYHVMDHFRLLRLATALQPKMIVIDSEFALRPGPTITLARERTDKPLNATPQTPGQKIAVVGIPSRAATELMAEALGYRTEWLDWTALKGEDRAGLWDYYRPRNKRRGTCILRPA